MIGFRDAVEADLPVIVGLLADDALGAGRETPDRMEPYRAAFAGVLAQGGRVLLAVEGDEVVGCLQLDLIANLSLGGMVRAQIEGVRVAPGRRGAGVGEALVREAMRLAREGGAGLMQLTTNLERVGARRFYERLGFVGSHVGMKAGL